MKWCGEVGCVTIAVGAEVCGRAIGRILFEPKSWGKVVSACTRMQLWTSWIPYIPEAEYTKIFRSAEAAKTFCESAVMPRSIMTLSDDVYKIGKDGMRK